MRGATWSGLKRAVTLGMDHSDAMNLCTLNMLYLSRILYPLFTISFPCTVQNSMGALYVAMRGPCILSHEYFFSILSIDTVSLISLLLANWNLL